MSLPTPACAGFTPGADNVPGRTERRQPRQHQQGRGMAGQELLTALVYETENGRITVSLDVRNPNDFCDESFNRQHIGKDGNKLVALWNADHPEDLVGKRGAIKGV